MNSHPDYWQAGSKTSLPQEQTVQYSAIQKAVTTLILLTLGYYALHFLDAWPSIIKRYLHEIIIYLIPSQVIYALQLLMAKYGLVSVDGLRFQKTDFGDQHAKAEAIHRMLGHTPIPKALKKARSLSGLEAIILQNREPGPPGLGNWDNSCYQNSILHGLASLPAFMTYLEKSLYLCDKVEVSASTHRALRLFLSQLSDTSRAQTTVWTPTVLKSMDSWQQQDAQEYFTRIMDMIDKEAVKCSIAMKRRLTTGLESLVQNRSAEEESIGLLRRFSLEDDALDEQSSEDYDLQRRSSSKERKINSAVKRSLLASQPKNPMDGQQAQALECRTCGFSEGGTATPFSCVTLNLGLRGQSYLENLLDEFTNPEIVEGVECTECTKALADGRDNKHESERSDVDRDQPSPSKRPKLKPVLRDKAKQITFSRLPKDLVLHINRSIFDDWGDQRKNASPVQFPTRLEFFRSWCWPPAPMAEQDDVEAVYELRCVVTHHGRHENGHYVAFAKRDKDWYCFNDEIVTRVNEADVLSRGNVFMLFYEAMDEQPVSKTVPEPAPVPDSEKAEHAVKADRANEPRQASHQQLSSSSSSGSDSDPAPEPGPVTPIRPVPTLRTASGSMPQVENKSLTTPHRVSAV